MESLEVVLSLKKKSCTCGNLAVLLFTKVRVPKCPIVATSSLLEVCQSIIIRPVSSCVLLSSIKALLHHLGLHIKQDCLRCHALFLCSVKICAHHLLSDVGAASYVGAHLGDVVNQLVEEGLANLVSTLTYLYRYYRHVFKKLINY